MQISELLTPERIFIEETPVSKKRILEVISQRLRSELPNNTLTAQDLFAAYFERERLGSTAVGEGVAIPHICICSKQINHPIGIFIKLKNSIDYDAFDNKPIDLLFAFAVPENQKDKCAEILTQLAKTLSNQQICEFLRNSNDKCAIYRKIVNNDQEALKYDILQASKTSSLSRGVAA